MCLTLSELLSWVESLMDLPTENLIHLNLIKHPYLLCDDRKFYLSKSWPASKINLTMNIIINTILFSNHMINFIH